MDNEVASEKSILAWMAGNHVASNLLMVVLLIGGLVAATMITQEVFPEYDLDIVKVSVSYPGASPEEVEKGIVLALEEEVRSLENVERVTSVATEGRASITIELLSGVDPNKAVQDVKNSVDRISSLPDDAEQPQVSLRTRRREVLRIALFGDIDERALYDYANKVREELIALPQITQVELRGVRQPELSIEVPQHILQTYGLSLGGIARDIRNKAVDVPAGGIKTQGGEVLLRTTERRDFAYEFDEIAIISLLDGTEVRLGDVATIKEGFEDADREAYYNGKKAVLVYVYRTGKQTPNEISLAARDYIDSLRQTLPAGLDARIYNDRSELYMARLKLLLKNGGLGLLLVLLALALFLEARLAFWVSMGIPISIIGSIVVLVILGGSINIVSMFAFIVTLGIIVDDAIVVGENIYYTRQKGMLSPLEASIKGGSEMASPVFVAVMTNVLAFMPLLFVSGSTGRFFSILPAVIISVFLISLVECLYILPSHLAYRRTENNGKFLSTLNKVPDYCGKGLQRFIESAYGPVLRSILTSRYLVLIVAVIVLTVAFAYVKTGWIDFSFRPRIQTDRIDAEIELPFGSRVEDVRRIAKLVEEGGLRAVEQSGGMRILDGTMTDIGRRGSNTAEITFNLVPQNEREITTREFSIRWRKEVGEIAGLERLFFDYLVGPGGSSAINVELTHPDAHTLEQAASDLALVLRNFKGVTDINDGYAQGKPQLDFTIKPEGRSVGLTAQDLGVQVRNAFYGAEAIRQQRERDEIKVRVRLPESERRSLYNLEQLLVRTPEGGEILLSQAANITTNRAYTEITRVDGKRVLNVTASVVPGQANENNILADLRAEYLPDMLAKYPGIKYSFEGRQRDKRIAMRDLMYGLLLIMPAIFCVLAILFRSYVQAFMVMMSIPFGLVSALIGHIIMGYDLSIISVFGMIALCGIVVNGGLVFTVTANKYMKDGMPPLEAAFSAAKRRFRPIFLTAITTFLGLAPMIFEQSVQARFLVPMAISLGYGILFSSFIILLLMPSLYVISHDLRKLY